MNLFDTDPRFTRTSTNFGHSYSNGHARVSHYLDDDSWGVNGERNVSEDYAYETALDEAREAH